MFAWFPQGAFTQPDQQQQSKIITHWGWEEEKAGDTIAWVSTLGWKYARYAIYPLQLD